MVKLKYNFRSELSRTRSESRWAFFSGLLGGAGGDAVLLELLPERVPVDAEELGGADLVSLGLAHDGAQQRLLHEPDHEGVQVGRGVTAQAAPAPRALPPPA